MRIGIYQRVATGIAAGFPSFRLARQQSVDEAGGALPPGCLLRECPDARPRDGVVLRLAIVFRRLPGPFYPALLLQTHQRGIQRALIESYRLLGHLLDPGGDAVSVLRPHDREGPKDDELEGAGQEF